jgi:hypothetical protein
MAYLTYIATIRYNKSPFYERPQWLYKPIFLSGDTGVTASNAVSIAKGCHESVYTIFQYIGGMKHDQC